MSNFYVAVFMAGILLLPGCNCAAAKENFSWDGIDYRKITYRNYDDDYTPVVSCLDDEPDADFPCL